MKKSIIALTAIGLISSTILVGLFSCRKETTTISDDSKNDKVEIAFKKEGELAFLNDGKVIKKINIEIAETDREQKQGLMYRSKMEEHNGMLFLRDKNEIQSFWMQNTRIPLDIIYVASDSTVVNIAKNATPYQERGIPPSTAPALFVVEINGGLADKWGIKDGETKITWVKDGTLNVEVQENSTESDSIK